MSASACALEKSRAKIHSCFRDDLVVTPPPADSVMWRYNLYDPRNDIGFELGRAEYSLALLFDGQRSLHDIAEAALAQHRIKVSPEKLAQFERKLLNLKLLSSEQTAHKKDLRDPATGITYGPLKEHLLINLVKTNPQPLLDHIYRLAPWCCRATFILPLLALALASFVYLGAHFGTFMTDAGDTYIQSYRWLLWHFPVILTSIALHELGHAMACRHYGVKVNDFGIGIYLLLATGWVRPVQAQWSRLPLNQRVITILAGPLVSLLYAGVGIVLWAMFRDSQGGLPALFVVMIVASLVSLVPTLLPIFNGDTYLAITEVLGQPRLRQRAFNYVKRHWRTAPLEAVSPALRRLYWSTFLLTCLGWVIAWCFTAATLIRLFNHP
ncbi:M50 family metallopeptidase [Pseudomonas sp. Irchel s3h17]|uniref:M50 family metallopeptidase n=1 Tax=Pseudomonas sp. Irchel s3h17 TaxID=2009182 RepID=UPI00155E40E8|nr:M50 family metallopeptidase [Pseudomonas sp. Irchel s3h17]